MTFSLNARLQQDCIELGRLQLCRLLLMNDNQYPWFILVPEKPQVSEIFQLNKPDRALLIEESSFLAKKLAEIYNADKINVASLGNIVSQLHVHHIVRYRNDKSWPGPVWGKFDPVPYTESELTIIKHHIKNLFVNYPFTSNDTI